MTKLTANQIEAFDNLFKTRYTDWSGTIYSLVDYCEKEIKLTIPKTKPALTENGQFLS